MTEHVPDWGLFRVNLICLSTLPPNGDAYLLIPPCYFGSMIYEHPEQSLQGRFWSSLWNRAKFTLLLLLPQMSWHAGRLVVYHSQDNLTEQIDPNMSWLNITKVLFLNHMVVHFEVDGKVGGKGDFAPWSHSGTSADYNSVITSTWLPCLPLFAIPASQEQRGLEECVWDTLIDQALWKEYIPWTPTILARIQSIGYP